MSGAAYIPRRLSFAPEELFDTWLATRCAHYHATARKHGLDGEMPRLSTAHFRRLHDRRGQMALVDAA